MKKHYSFSILLFITFFYQIHLYSHPWPTISVRIDGSTDRREEVDPVAEMTHNGIQEVRNRLRANSSAPAATQKQTQTKNDGHFSNEYKKQLENYTAAKFQQHFEKFVSFDLSSITSEDAAFVFSHYDFYQYEAFLRYARNIPGWAEHIKELYEKLKNDEQFAKSTRELPGYQSTFWEGLRKVCLMKSRFYKDVEREYNRILQQEKIYAEQVASCVEQTRNIILQQNRPPLLQSIWFERAKLDCRNLIEDFESLIPSTTKIPEINTLVVFGKECSEIALNHCYENLELAQRHYARATAIYKTILEEKRRRWYNLQSITIAQNYAKHKGILIPDQYAFRPETEIQYIINTELITTLNEATPIFKYANNTCVDALASHLILATSSAHEANNKNLLLQACALSDYSDAISQVGQRFIDFLNSGCEFAQHIVRGGIHGIVEGGVQYVADWKQCITNPPAALRAYYHALKSAGWALSKVVQTIRHPLINGPKIAALSKHLFEEARKNPELATKNVTSFLSQCLVSKKLDPKLFAQGSALASHVQKEFENLKKVADETGKLKNVIAPISTIVEKAQKIEITLNNYKNLTLQEFEKLTEKLPKFLRNNKTYQEFSDLKQKSPHVTDYNYVHIFHGEMQKAKDGNIRLLKGMHTKDGFEEFVRHSKIPRDQFHIEELANGVIRVKMPRNAFHSNKLADKASTYLSNGELLESVKTLWPSHYTPQQILEEAHSIIQNPLNKTKRFEYIGSTKDNIKIKVWVDEKGSILTALPTWEQ